MSRSFLLAAFFLPGILVAQAQANLDAQMAMALTEHDVPRVLKLIQAGVNPSGRMPIQRGNKTSPSYLHHAVNASLVEPVQQLLKKGADIHAKSFDDVQVMHIVAKSRNDKRLEIAKLLLAHGARTQLNTCDSDGQTPVHWAAIAQNHGLTELFAKAGADLNAFSRGQGGGFSPLTLAAGEGRTEAVVLLLKLGVEAKGEQGFIAMDLAAKGEHVEIIGLLATAGAPTLKPGEHESNAPVSARPLLNRAVYSGKPKVVEALVAAGADVNIPFESYGGNDGNDVAKWGGLSPLMTAVAYRDDKTALALTRALLKANPDLHASARNPKHFGNMIIIPPPPPEEQFVDHTALSLARKHERSELVRLLQVAGAKR